MPSGWREQYDRMMRWHAVLAESTDVTERRVDEFSAFFGCAFHLKDWLKADLPAGSGVGPDDVEAFVNERLWLRLCADIANGSKHFRLTRRARFDAEARVEQATAGFSSGFSPAFARTEMIVVPAGGTAWDAMRVAEGCVAAWKEFLGGRGLLGEDAAGAASKRTA